MPEDAGRGQASPLTRSNINSAFPSAPGEQRARFLLTGGGGFEKKKKKKAMI